MLKWNLVKAGVATPTVMGGGTKTTKEQIPSHSKPYGRSSLHFTAVVYFQPRLYCCFFFINIWSCWWLIADAVLRFLKCTSSTSASALAVRQSYAEAGHAVIRDATI